MGQTEDSMDTLLTLRLPPIEAEASWQLVEWCMSKGADEFTLAGVHTGGDDPSSVALFQAFDKVATGYRLPPAPREHLSKRPNEEWMQDTSLWRLNEETILLLKQVLPEGVFTYDVGSEAWFEDLAVYRQRNLMLGIISHEREGILQVTEREKAELESAGYCLATLSPRSQEPPK
jgi:hypothetical protein